jgi:hypothetical protein
MDKVNRNLAAQGKAIHLGTSEGNLKINEDDLDRITDAQLAELSISRKELHRVFAEGVRLMQSRGVKPSHRARPVADQRLDGKWEVHIVGYSPLTDSLMNVEGGSA